MHSPHGCANQVNFHAVEEHLMPGGQVMAALPCMQTTLCQWSGLGTAERDLGWKSSAPTPVAIDVVELEQRLAHVAIMRCQALSQVSIQGRATGTGPGQPRDNLFRHRGSDGGLPKRR